MSDTKERIKRVLIESLVLDGLEPSEIEDQTPLREELGLDSLVTETQSLTQEHVLKNAFGFGGCNACLVFRRLRAGLQCPRGRGGAEAGAAGRRRYPLLLDHLRTAG